MGETKPTTATVLSKDRAELLALTDHALVEAQRYKAQWLATGDLTAYRLWQAVKRDREMLLRKVGDD